jgi:hypothetical protein
MRTATGNSDDMTEEVDLAAPVHHVLTFLIRLRSGAPLSSQRLNDRIQRVRALRPERADVEALLVAAHDRPASTSTG